MMRRRIRRLGLLLLGVLLALGMLAGPAAAAGTATSSYTSLLDRVPWAVIFGLIATQGIPYLSQLVTRKPTWWTTAATAALSFVDALLSQLASADFNHANWRVIVGLSFGFTAFAYGHHFAWIRGTDFQTWLINRGNAPQGNAPATPATPAAPPAAPATP